MFNRPEWHDPILLVKYIMHGLGLLFALAAVIGPVLLAIFDDPASLAGTFFFIIAGVVLLVLYLSKKKNMVPPGEVQDWLEGSVWLM